MIQNLNPISFQKYGTILNSKSAQIPAPEQRRSLTLRFNQIPVRYCQENVQLFPDPGLCVLSVAFDDEEYVHFYLDKSVCLANGVHFFLTPFSGNASMQLAGKYTMLTALQEAPDFRVRPQLVIPRLYTFFYQEQEQGFLFPGESHRMYELTYVDKGTLHSVVDGQDFLQEAGDFVLFGPEQWHMHYADIGVAPCYVTISFDAEGCDLTPLMNRKFKSPQKGISLLQQMLKEQERSPMYSEDMILCLLVQLLLILLRQSQSPEYPLQNPQCLNNENEIICRAQQYISENVRNKLSVPLVAKNADVSPSYLTTLFHKHLQIPPGEYIRRIKLQESKQLIREDKLNISQIAEALQYSTIHHFSRQFKDKFGMTPTEYAKSVK